MSDAPPAWLDGPPIEPGLYWWCWHDGEGRPINGTMRPATVYRVGHRLMVSGDNSSIPVTKPRRLWYGPLREPKPPRARTPRRPRSSAPATPTAP